MEKMPLISIIVPVYNVERHLRECLNSLVGQTYKNKEIILVDDGSSDSSPMICDEFAIENTFVKVYHIENGGVANARNVGINNSSGEYLVFVDSDDVLDQDYLKTAYEALNNNDYLSAAFFRLVNGEKQNKVDYLKRYGEEISIEEYLEVMIDYQAGAYWGANWGKLFNAGIIKNHNILFEGNVHFAEDFRFNLEYLKYVQRVSIVHEPIYFYRVDTGGSLSKKKRDWFKYWDEYLELYKRYVVLYKTKNCFNKNEEKLKNFVRKAIIEILRSSIRENNLRTKNAKKVFSYIEKSVDDKELLPNASFWFFFKLCLLEIRLKFKCKSK